MVNSALSSGKMEEMQDNKNVSFGASVDHKSRTTSNPYKQFYLGLLDKIDF